MNHEIESTTPASPEGRRRHNFSRGERIYESGTANGYGRAWRIVSGSVRLDRPGGDGEAMFASLAIPGDVIGSETIVLGQTGFAATALLPCVLEPWPEAPAPCVGAASPEALSVSLSRNLVMAERRATEVIALRCGHAMERVQRLVLLLANGAGDATRGVRVVLPTLRDMAEITALKIETVSRAIGHLRRDGLLQADKERKPGVPVRGSYALHTGSLAAV